MILGILILLFRRTSADLLLLSSLLGLYVALHLDVIGLAEISYRLARFLSVETFVFYSLMAVAIAGIPAAVKSLRPYMNQVSIVLGILFILFTLFTQGKQAYATLDTAYQGLGRVNPYQYEASEWIQENIDGDGNFMVHYGTLGYAKQRFFRVLSHVATAPFDFSDPKAQWENINLTYRLGLDPDPISFTHVLFDYSDFALINSPEAQAAMEMMLNIEQKAQPNLTLLYNQNNIRVYKLES